jgi:hypothetical protein
MGGGGSKKSGKSVTYYLNGPLLEKCPNKKITFLALHFGLYFCL